MAFNFSINKSDVEKLRGFLGDFESKEEFIQKLGGLENKPVWITLTPQQYEALAHKAFSRRKTKDSKHYSEVTEAEKSDLVREFTKKLEKDIVRHYLGLPYNFGVTEAK